MIEMKYHFLKINYIFGMRYNLVILYCLIRKHLEYFSYNFFISGGK